MSAGYGERLGRALLAAGKTRLELAAILRRPDGELGVSVSAVGQVLAGHSKSLTAENSALAAKFLGVNHSWLALGVGPMLDQSPADLRAQEPVPPFGLSDAELLRQLRGLLQRVAPEVRAGVADVLAAWARDGGSDDRTGALRKLISSEPGVGNALPTIAKAERR